MTDIKMPKNYNFVNITGKRYGRLIVISFHSSQKRESTYWRCRCDCGNECIVAKSSLHSRAKSCGCYRKDRLIKHNMCYSLEYKSWSDMKARCLNPKNHAYKYYGGRGIIVCDRWKDSFENFIADMGKKSTPDYTLDRIDNNKGYSPDNCRWTTRKRQCRNQRSNVIINYYGKNILLIELAETLGINMGTLKSRLKNGWSLEKAIETPVRKKV